MDAIIPCGEGRLSFWPAPEHPCHHAFHTYWPQMWEMVTALPLYVGMKANQIRVAVRDGGLRPEFPAYIVNSEYK